MKRGGKAFPRAGSDRLTTRYTHVSASEGASRKAQNSLALGAQAWLRERIRIAFEYRFQKGSRPDEGVLSIDFVL